MPDAPDDRKTIVEMLRMAPRDLKAYMRDIFIEQLEAGHDYFVWVAAPLPEQEPTSADVPPVLEDDYPTALPALTRHTLREWRISQGMTQQGLAMLLGIRPQQLSAYETGQGTLPAEAQQKARIALMFPPDEEAKEQGL